MNFEVETIIEPDLVYIRVSGEFSFVEMYDMVDRFKIEADKADRNCVLVDFRNFSGNLTEAERFQGGQKIAQVFGSRIKAAMLLPQTQVTKLGELTAVNRGAKFLATSSEDEARNWLLKA